MNKTIAEDGDRLDQIAFKHYGTLQNFEAVLKANIHLIDKVVLTAGNIVCLPEINSEIIKEVKTLWN